MKNIAKIGPMYLLEIRAVRKQLFEAGDMVVYMIDFGDCQLAATALHAFTCSDDSLKSTSELQRGDRIWVDVSAFMSDGSFTRNNSPPPAPRGPENRLIKEGRTISDLGTSVRAPLVLQPSVARRYRTVD